MSNKNTYTCFLRGINVGGNNKILMKDLSALLVKNGCKNVKTYIQSGNIVLSSSLTQDKIEENITHLIKATYGFDVPCTTISKEHLTNLIVNNPFIGDASLIQKNIYFTICDREILKEDVSLIKESKQFTTEKIHAYKDTIYIYYEQGYGKTKVHNNFIERKLKLSATTRNLNTMNKMVLLME